jgi:rhamnosyltransferase
MPAVSVLLRTLNPGPDFAPLLDRLAAQALAPAEILVVDSGSQDGTPERARHAGVRLVEIEPSRFTHARSTNLGFREARFPIVAMLSQDALPLDKYWLDRLVAPLEDPGVAAVFGRQVPRAGCFPLESWELERSYPMRGEPAVSYSNVNSAARRSVWEALPFDESVLIAEDRFWANEVRRRGLKVSYAPAAAVEHSHQYSLPQVYARCRAEAQARRDVEGDREGWGLLVKGWPRQAWRDALRLAAEGEAWRWPHAAAYRFAQFAGLVRGGRD